MKRESRTTRVRSHRAIELTANGGYDDGYSRCACFWGRLPGSLVRHFIGSALCKGLRVLDLGCGEGKNAYAFARAGAIVTAVDCSELAIANGRTAFTDGKIEWVVSDGATYLLECEPFDVVVMYGLLHCLPSRQTISTMIDSALQKTLAGGHHLVATFNDGPHDLSAHPGFRPTLASHEFYLRQYRQHEVVSQSLEIIHEVHPHNSIPHYHSLTRLTVRKTT